MIHVVFRETGVQVGDLNQLEALANALVNASYKNPIMLYIEINDATEFASLVKLLRVLSSIGGDINKFQSHIDEMMKTKEELENLINKESAQKVKVVDVDAKAEVETTIQHLRSGVMVNSYVVRLNYEHGLRIEIEQAKKFPYTPSYTPNST